MQVGWAKSNVYHLKYLLIPLRISVKPDFKYISQTGQDHSDPFKIRVIVDINLAFGRIDQTACFSF